MGDLPLTGFRRAFQCATDRSAALHSEPDRGPTQDATRAGPEANFESMPGSRRPIRQAATVRELRSGRRERWLYRAALRRGCCADECRQSYMIERAGGVRSLHHELTERCARSRRVAPAALDRNRVRARECHGHDAHERRATPCRPGDASRTAELGVS